MIKIKAPSIKGYLKRKQSVYQSFYIDVAKALDIELGDNRIQIDSVTVSNKLDQELKALCVKHIAKHERVTLGSAEQAAAWHYLSYSPRTDAHGCLEDNACLVDVDNFLVRGK